MNPLKLLALAFVVALSIALYSQSAWADGVCSYTVQAGWPASCGSGAWCTSYDCTDSLCDVPDYTCCWDYIWSECPVGLVCSGSYCAASCTCPACSPPSSLCWGDPCQRMFTPYYCDASTCPNCLSGSQYYVDDDSCDKCPVGQECSGGSCVVSCTPSCAGKECGDDGCGGSCGSCPAGWTCEGDFAVNYFGTCTGGVCDSIDIDCNANNGMYCNGDIAESRDYTCTGAGSCSTYSVVFDVDCNGNNGWYSTGLCTEEYRDYTCTGAGSCSTYAVTKTQNKADGTACTTSDGDSGECISGSCISSAPTCTGTVALSLSPNPADPLQIVTADTTGLTGCTGETVFIKDGSCSGPDVTNCVIGASGTGCSSTFTAPAAGTGDKIYSACDADGDDVFG